MKKVLLILIAIFIPCLLLSCAPVSSTAAPSGGNGGITVTENINGAEIAKMSTEHFDFCSFDKDTTYLEELGKTLEDNFGRITTDLMTEISDRITIYIYPDLERFHTAISRPDAPEWVVGTIDGPNIIKMVSPKNAGTHSYEDMLKTAVHEFTHIVASKINSDFDSGPIWLNEGIAAYESGQTPGKIDTLHVPPLDDLNSESFNELGGYQYSYTIVEFIVKEDGYEKLNALIKSPDDIENVLGVSKDEFYTNWTGYLKEHY